MQKTYTQSRWNLKDLFPGLDSEAVQMAFDRLVRLADHLEIQKPTLDRNITPEKFRAILEELDAFQHESQRLRAYANLLRTENTADQPAEDFFSRVTAHISAQKNRIIFFELWWKNLDGENAKRLIEPAGRYAAWLRSLRKDRPYTLSESEEKIIQSKNVTGRQAIETLYNKIVSQYQYHLVMAGENRTLNRGEIMRFMQHPDPDLRAASMQEHFRPFIHDRQVLGHIYQTIANDWRNEYVDLRGYQRPVSYRNAVNDIPDEVVDTVLAVAEKNVSVFQRFFKIKAGLLGMEKMRRYDLYAPISTTDKILPFEEASAQIVESFNTFDPRFGELAERMFAEKHIDSEARKNKDFLPFCANADHQATPYINVFYQGKIRDASTLQHEIGHAIHAMLAGKNPSFTANPSLPLAETASIFSEMLFIDKLLEEENDPAVRREILMGQIEHAYAGIQRQAFTAIFENKAHDMIAEGASIDEIAEVYLFGLTTQFGESMDVSDEFRWEWLGYPHIYQWPFYVYAYTFGHLVVLSLYQKYKSEGASFVPKYIAFLSAGNSEPPVALLNKMDVDPYSPSFWQGGYDLISQMIDRIGL